MPQRGRPRKSPELLLRTVNLRLPASLHDAIQDIHAARPEEDLADVLRDLLWSGVRIAQSATGKKK